MSDKPLKSYSVEVEYIGAIEFTVEATSEKEAIKRAKKDVPFWTAGDVLKVNSVDIDDVDET